MELILNSIISFLLGILSSIIAAILMKKVIDQPAGRKIRRKTAKLIYKNILSNAVPDRKIIAAMISAEAKNYDLPKNEVTIDEVVDEAVRIIYTSTILNAARKKLYCSDLLTLKIPKSTGDHYAYSRGTFALLFPILIVILIIIDIYRHRIFLLSILSWSTTFLLSHLPQLMYSLIFVLSFYIFYLLWNKISLGLLDKEIDRDLAQ